MDVELIARAIDPDAEWDMPLSPNSQGWQTQALEAAVRVQALLQEAMDVEALARLLAAEEAHAHVMSDSWFGFPDPDDPEQMRESIEIGLPHARKKALRYAAALGVAEQPEGRVS